MHTLKKHLTALGIGLLACTGMVQGQGYEPVLDKDSLVYTMKYLPIGYDDAGGRKEPVRKKTLSDTVFKFNNKNYRRLIKYDTLKKDVKQIYLREDTAQGKLWALNITKERFNEPLDTTEHLVMNLNLERGDTFRIPYDRMEYGNNDSLFGKVDSVAFIEGKKVVTINVIGRTNYFGESSNKLKIGFVEGIGPTHGFSVNGNIKRGNTPDDENLISYNNIICAKIANELKYSYRDSLIYGEKTNLITIETPFSKGRSFKSCPTARRFRESIGLKNQRSGSEFLEKYPQPSKNIVNIRLHQKIHEPLELQIFTLKGQLVHQQIIHTQTFQIHRPGNSQIYSYRLLSSKKELKAHGKLIFK